MKYIITLSVLVVCAGLLAGGALAQGMTSDKCQKCMDDQNRSKMMNDCTNNCKKDKKCKDRCEEQHGCSKECSNK